MHLEKDDVLKGFFAFAYIAILASLVFNLFDKHIDSIISLFKNRGVMIIQKGEIIDPKYAPCKEFHYTIKPARTISPDRWAELQRLLEKGKFEELNTILHDYHLLVEKDPAAEDKVHDAFRVFGQAAPGHGELLKQWVARHPNSYQAHLALAQHYYAMGLKEQGVRSARQASKKPATRMNDSLAQAVNCIKRAQRLEPRAIVGYNLLIDIYNVNGNEVAVNSQLKKSLTLFPHSFLLRYKSMWANRPGSGGSYAAMAAIAKEAEQFYAVNPRLRLLYGLIYCDRGDVLRSNKRHGQALADYEKAISFGDHWYFHGQLAKVFYYDLKDNDSALKAINKALADNPLSAESYLLRAKVHHALEYYAKGFDDMQLAQRLDAANRDMREWREWAANDLVQKGYEDHKAGFYRDAIDKYGLAGKFDAQNKDVFYYRAIANLELPDRAAAISDLGRAVALAPNDFELYRKLDALLAQEGDWDMIIEYWNRFLLQQPDHAKAYFERSNAYFNKKDMENAANDLQKACDLGLDAGCRRYNWVRSKAAKR